MESAVPDFPARLWLKRLRKTPCCLFHHRKIRTMRCRSLNVYSTPSGLGRVQFYEFGMDGMLLADAVKGLTSLYPLEGLGLPCSTTHGRFGTTKSLITAAKPNRSSPVGCEKTRTGLVSTESTVMAKLLPRSTQVVAKCTHLLISASSSTAPARLGGKSGACA